ncbi:hypothetical protein AMS68_003477 [Peltaster fructicola]|uniref:CCAAT-binding factor domain-containing protein n=1 Tax=Peltaster fructicola TaxID=286661 RepID=A0A6H0XU30_9PEZI|nr:hypothetical protein AMS68_003477 [Peltaster fructicola]
MPGIIAAQPDRKRKRLDAVSAAKSTKPRKAAKLEGGDVKSRILQCEQDSLSAEKRHDALTELTTIINDGTQKTTAVVLAAVTLCRTFCRLIASEEIQQSRSQLKNFTQTLISWIGDPDATLENAAVTLLMRIVKEEVLQDSVRAEQAWRATSNFANLVKALLTTSEAEGGRAIFVEKYVEEFDDVRYHTLVAIKQAMKDEDCQTPQAGSNALHLLAQVEGIPDSQEQLEDWYGRKPEGNKHILLSLAAHRKAAQEAWLAVFRSELSHEHRKRILEIMNAQILPWFSGKLEILTDFLTDSFNASGSTAVLALGGIFHLMTERNIDYPDFYDKLYSLLDTDILHSKHRNSFLRLLDNCLASTHLPAALVASFVKRIARLALQAPPGAIVWAVPWTYNLLKSHPTCTFMLHREENPTHVIYAKHPKPMETGMNDPFDMTEPDPMLTKAIDSSLWELEVLRTHYHPNVATLTGIIAEQWTKKDYHLEDFLDHTYATLLDGELGRELKKEPVVEWEIPKHIFTAMEGEGKLNSLGDMLQTAIDAL